MTFIAFRRRISQIGAHLTMGHRQTDRPTNPWQDKSADRGRASLVGFIEYFRHYGSPVCWHFLVFAQRFQPSQRRRRRFASGASR